MAKTEKTGPNHQLSDIQAADLLELQATHEENAKLLRKIDLTLMPVMCACYMLQLLDKLTLNYSSQLGLTQDLNLHGSQYSWTSSIFYFGYLMWTWPSSWLAVRLPLGKYLTGTVLVWGVIVMCHGVCNNFRGFMAVRFLLGAAEAAVAPGFALIVSIFYRRNEQPLRQGIWFAGNCIANIVGGLISYGIGHIQSSLANWRVLFLVLGGVTVAYSAILWKYLPDSPTKARMLSERERKLSVLRMLQETTSAMDENDFQNYQVWEALRDTQAWLLALYTFSVNICNGGITTFNSLLINGFGFGSLQTLLLQIPIGGCQLAFLAVISISASVSKTSRLFLMACGCLLSMVGMLLIYKLDHANAYGRLGGTYLAAVFASNTPMSLSLIASNVGGFTKRSTVNAMLFIAYSAGNIVGPQLYLSSQAPVYTTGVCSNIAGFCLGTLFLGVLFVYYLLENRKRTKHCNTLSGVNTEEERQEDFLHMTDQEDWRFRYVL